MGYYSAEEKEVAKTPKQLPVFERKSGSISFDFRLINHCFEVSARLHTLLNSGGAYTDGGNLNGAHINSGDANGLLADLPSNGWRNGYMVSSWFGVR